MNKVAYIIVGWNNQKLLAECFDSIEAQTYSNKRIIYVDNHSSDGSVDWVAKNYPQVTVLAQNRNRGFAKGNNIGIAEALKEPDTDYVALINSDARLDREWTARIVKFAEQKPKGACFQGTTLDYYDHGRIDSTHIYVSHNGQGTQGNWRHLYLSELGPKKVFGVNAAACIISRRFIETQPFGAKVFDEAFYMYLEDIDLAARATMMGWDNYLVREARAYHMGSASTKKRSSNFSLYMTFRNNSAVLVKNFPLKMLWRIWPKLVRGDWDTIITLWRRQEKTAIWAVIKGRLVGISRIPVFISKRHKMSQVRQIDKGYLWLLMNKGR